MAGRASSANFVSQRRQASNQLTYVRTHRDSPTTEKTTRSVKSLFGGRCGGLHHATRSVSPMRALVGGERRLGAHDLYNKKHLLVEGATGKGGFADGQDTAPSSEETRLRAQVRRTRSFLRQRRSGSDAHSASRTSAFVCVCLLPRCPHLLIHFTFHGDALRRMNGKNKNKKGTCC